MHSQRRLIWQIPFMILLVIGTVLIVRQHRHTPYQTNQGFVFGTVYHITYQYDSDLGAAITDVLRQVDKTMSTFNKLSTVSAINQGGDPPLNDLFVQIYQLSRRVSEETDGAFDVTVAPLVNAWGFGFKHNIVPTDHAIDSLCQFVGYRKIALVLKDGHYHLKRDDSRTMLDFSAIAKGYGCDAVAALFRRKGIQNFMVEIGGEIVVSGVNHRQEPWHIGVAKPTEDSLCTNQNIQTVLQLSDRAMATSGNYRNFYYKDGKKYAHTINPKTGRPVEHTILSATVIARECAIADAYATSFMVMGLDKAKRLLLKHPELQAYLIYTDKTGRFKVWSNISEMKSTP